MTPIVVTWESSICFNFLDEGAELEPCYDMRALTRADSATRGTFYKTMFNLGAYSPNDIRDAEGENPVTGGNQRFVPVNMTVLKPNMQPSTAAQPPNSDPEDDEEGDASDSESEDQATPDKPADQPSRKPKKKKKRAEVEQRAMYLASGAADRLARREYKTILAAVSRGPDAIREAYGAHARVIAEALCVSIEAASAYCANRQETVTAHRIQDDFELTARCALERLALEGET
jgi:hypothetical protein